MNCSWPAVLLECVPQVGATVFCSIWEESPGRECRTLRDLAAKFFLGTSCHGEIGPRKKLP